MRNGKRFIGTARFASVNTHFGREQSRRDDLECLGYSLAYLFRGELPWQGLEADNKNEKYEKIKNKKISTPIDELCKGLPIEFVRYMHYCKNLQFEDKPDYTQLRKQFKDCYERNEFEKGFDYDWVLLSIDLTDYPKKTARSSDSLKPEREQIEENKARIKGIHKSNTAEDDLLLSKQLSRKSEIQRLQCGMHPKGHKSNIELLSNQKDEPSRDQINVPEIILHEIQEVDKNSGLEKLPSLQKSKSSDRKDQNIRLNTEDSQIIGNDTKREDIELKKSQTKARQKSEQFNNPFKSDNEEDIIINKTEAMKPMLLQNIISFEAISLENTISPLQTSSPQQSPEVPYVSNQKEESKNKIKELADIRITTKKKQDNDGELNSCNFSLKDIIENINLFGKSFKFKNIIIDDSIPIEKPLHNIIVVPSCTFIRNTLISKPNRHQSPNFRKTKTQEALRNNRNNSPTYRAANK